MQQTDKRFETLFVIKDQLAKGAEKLTKSLARCQVIVTTDNDTDGNVERHLGMMQADGDYVAWLSGDNVAYPDFVFQHMQQLKAKTISIINCHYWGRDGYCGVFPRALQFGEMDIINYAMPVDIAKEIDAFGKDYSNIPDAQVFDAAKSRCKVVWDKKASPCAAHY